MFQEPLQHMMNSSTTESVLVNACPSTSTATFGTNSDVNENNATKGPRLLAPTVSSMGDGTVPLVASPAAIVTSMPFSQVSSPQNVVAFPTGINLTISNGKIKTMTVIAVNVVMKTCTNKIVIKKSVCFRLQSWLDFGAIPLPVCLKT